MCTLLYTKEGLDRDCYGIHQKEHKYLCENMPINCVLVTCKDKKTNLRLVRITASKPNDNKYVSQCESTSDRKISFSYIASVEDVTVPDNIKEDCRKIIHNTLYEDGRFIGSIGIHIIPDSIKPVLTPALILIGKIFSKELEAINYMQHWTPKIKPEWRIRLKQRLNPSLDGTQNVNVLPLTDDPEKEIKLDICKKSIETNCGHYLEDLITICNPMLEKSGSGKCCDLHSKDGSFALDVKMSTETVKKGDKDKSGETLSKKCSEFNECFFVEFFGAPGVKEYGGVKWYSGEQGQQKLNLTPDDVKWIACHLVFYRKHAFDELKSADWK